MIQKNVVPALLAAVVVSMLACTSEKKGGPPDPVKEELEGAARPSLLLTHAWFWDDENGKPRPGWARLDIWRPDASGKWTRTRLEDPESNVFHKAVAYDGGILTIGAENATVFGASRCFLTLAERSAGPTVSACPAANTRRARGSRPRARR